MRKGNTFIGFCRHLPFIINFDGEPFFGIGLKAKIKSLILRKADGYLVAGQKAADSVRKNLGYNDKIIPYYFSSLNDEEIKKNADLTCERGKTVLVVGQYYPYKGMDIALNVARQDKTIRYKFVGMGKRTSLFYKEMGEIPANVEIIPFLQKSDLELEYRRCALLLLPSRQECWGLVINEAASFGTPIVSTRGSGAAIEFLEDKYSCYLAEPCNVEDLYDCVHKCLFSDNKEYSDYLKEKSKCFSIEKNVEAYMEMICLK